MLTTSQHTDHFKLAPAAWFIQKSMSLRLRWLVLYNPEAAGRVSSIDGNVEVRQLNEYGQQIADILNRHYKDELGF